MRTIFLFIRGVDQTGRAFEKPRRDLTEMEKRQQDLARSSQRLLFGGAAFLAFAGMLAFGLAKIIEQSSRGAMMLGDLGVAVQRLISGISEAMTQIAGPSIQGLTKWLDNLSRSPFWVQILAWVGILAFVLTALAGISAWLGWIGIKLVIPITNLIFGMGAFEAFKATLLAKLVTVLGGTIVGGILQLTLPIILALIITYVIEELGPSKRQRARTSELLGEARRQLEEGVQPEIAFGGWFGQVWKGLTERREQFGEKVVEGLTQPILNAWTALKRGFGAGTLALTFPAVEVGKGRVGLAAPKTQLFDTLVAALGGIGKIVGGKLSVVIPTSLALIISYVTTRLVTPVAEGIAEVGKRLTEGIKIPSIAERINEWFTQLGKSFGEGFTQLGEGIDRWFARTRENLTAGIEDIPIRLTFPITGLIIGANAFLALKTQLLDALTTALGGTVVSGILSISVPVTLALIISNIISKQFNLKNTALLETLNEVKGDIGEFEDLKRGRAGGFAQLWERIVNYINVSIDMSNSHYPPGTSPEDVADAVGKKMAEDAANLGSRPGE